MFQTSSNDIVKRTLATVAVMVGAWAVFVGGVSLALVILIGQVKGGTSSDSATDTATTNEGSSDPNAPASGGHNVAGKAPARTAQIKPAQRI